MANNQLSEKLDKVRLEDLGIEFDEAKVWGELDARLQQRSYPYAWWLAVACLILLTSLPISLLKDIRQPATIDLSDVAIKAPVPEITVPENIESVYATNDHVTQAVLLDIRRNQSPQLAVFSQSQMTLKPVEVKSNQTEELVFNQKDISIIQASLESPTFENGRKVTIRAQWHKSPNEVHVSNQALKIKLYEKNK